MKKKLLFISAILFFGSTFITSTSAQRLTIMINNIEDPSKGKIHIAFFTSQSQLEHQKPVFIKSYAKSGIENGKLKIVIPVKSGIYGLSVLDDEDANGVMKYNFLGIPTEGFGFSNFDLNKIKMPKFDDFKFNIGDNESKTVTVNMKYLF